MRTPLLLAFASLTALLVVSCSQNGPEPRTAGSLPCTTLACPAGLHLAWEKGPWKPGMYTFDISLDGATTTCTARLPLPACETGPGFRCGPGASVVLDEAGCSLPPEQQGFSGFYIDAMPAHARIAVRRDGLEVGAQELDARYEEYRPNGPDCEPTCRRASDTLRLPR